MTCSLTRQNVQSTTALAHLPGARGLVGREDQTLGPGAQPSVVHIGLALVQEVCWRDKDGGGGGLRACV